MAEVVLERVVKTYEKTKVIQDVSLEVRDKEFLVLVGPSGCGKSTILRMIAGLETISDGKIRIGDRVVNDVPPKDRDIAMVFQNYALYPHMSVYDNMAFGLKMRKTPKDEIDRRVRDVAKILDLETYLDRKPKQLSGGQRQRVALGRAIVRDPKVFLMDEPLSNLDAKLRVQMRSEIAKLHRRLNATTIYVTHDQVEAMTMGDRIVILHQGKIQQVDSPIRVYQKPTNMFVAGFVGQMNFLTGALENGSLKLSDGTLLPLPASYASKLINHKNNIVLGLRPENIVPADSPEAGFELTVTPDRLELLGSDQMIHFQVAGDNVVAKWSSDIPVVEGQPLKVRLVEAYLHLFDGVSQERID